VLNNKVLLAITDFFHIVGRAFDFKPCSESKHTHKLHTHACPVADDRTGIVTNAVMADFKNSQEYMEVQTTVVWLWGFECLF